MLQSFVSAVWLLLRLIPENEESILLAENHAAITALVVMRAVIVCVIILQLGATVRHLLEMYKTLACFSVEIFSKTDKNVEEIVSVLMKVLFTLLVAQSMFKIAERAAENYLGMT